MKIIFHLFKLVSIFLFLVFLFCISNCLDFCGKIYTKDFLYFKNKDYSSKIIFRDLSEHLDVFGNIINLNYYYVNLYLGDSMKKQGFLLDTGSTITTTPCKPYCNHCGQHLNSYYVVNDEKKIIDCKNVKCSLIYSKCDKNNDYCSFEVKYSENSSLKGIYINEQIRFGNKPTNNKGAFAPIGCTTYEDNFFYTQQADGIMGLSNSETNFVSTLYKLNLINRNIFSLCFSLNGGYFSVGDIKEKYHKEKIKYNKFDKDYFYYRFNVNEIKIHNKSLSKKIYPSIIDSGSTLTKIPIEVANEIIETFSRLCKVNEKEYLCDKYIYHSELGPCYIFNTTIELNKIVENVWPSIIFSLDNYSYIWKPKNYVYNITISNQIYGCLGFIKSNTNGFIFGANWMIDHEIIFDNENIKLGFTEADCSEGQPWRSGKEELEQPNNSLIKKIIINFDKTKFIIYFTIIVILLIIIILLVISILFLRKGKNFLFLTMSKTLAEEEFLGEITGIGSIDRLNFDINKNIKDDINDDIRTKTFEMNITNILK